MRCYKSSFVIGLCFGQPSPPRPEAMCASLAIHCRPRVGAFNGFCCRERNWHCSTSDIRSEICVSAMKWQPYLFCLLVCSFLVGNFHSHGADAEEEDDKVQSANLACRLTVPCSSKSQGRFLFFVLQNKETKKSNEPEKLEPPVIAFEFEESVFFSEPFTNQADFESRWGEVRAMGSEIPHHCRAKGNSCFLWRPPVFHVICCHVFYNRLTTIYKSLVFRWNNQCQASQASPQPVHTHPCKHSLSGNLKEKMGTCVLFDKRMTSVHVHCTFFQAVALDPAFPQGFRNGIAGHTYFVTWKK